MKRFLFRISAIALLLLGLGLYESRLRPAVAARDLPTGSAEWIWAEDLSAADGWVTYFLYRDFEVGPSLPERAELVVEADGGYWAFVNQHAVGSGAYREHAAVDAYEVAAMLRPGANRVVFQVRSRRGVGGLLASLRLGGRGSVVTDGSWKTFRRYENSVLENGFVPEDVGRVKSWGRPPVGAWHVAREVVRVPVLADQLLPVQSAGVVRIRALGARDWNKKFPAPEAHEPLGRWVIFDLGRVVSGYINVTFAERSGARGLLYTSLDRPAGPDASDPAAWFVSPPGRGSWSEAQPREFRFVTVLALAEISGLRVFETPAEWVAARGAGEIRSRRAFGFAPPPSATTVEDEFWRELERVTGLTGREAFEGVLGG